MARKPSLGAHLRNARKKQKLRVRDVAAHMDISDSAFYCWETDRKRPSDANLITLCEILKLPVKATKALAAL
jgi:transcriptional regulator with XRE-family HTH domain